MTEWEKHKVADLKEECKARQISITGLKLKQQYIDKLVEYESAVSQDATPAEESVAEKTNGAFEEVDKDDTPLEDSTKDQSEDKSNGGLPEEPSTEDVPLAIETDENLPKDRPAALKVEDSQASDAAQDEDTPMAETAEEARELRKDDMLIPEPEQLQVQHEDTSMDIVEEKEDDKSSSEEQLKEAISGPEPTQIVDKVSDTDIPDSESRKRKRRSKTPSVDAEEILKKAKSSSGDAVPTKRGSRSPSPKSPKPRGSDEEPSSVPSTRQEDSNKEVGSDAVMNKEQSADRSPSVERHDTVEPALHAATRSLYLKNFKRPLNIQTLRSHIRTVAQGASVAQDEDPIKFFNVNSIRSHAFVTLSSITAASRVRAAMHQTRFPDEPQRDPLWVDFVPDEKVENWVEQETGGTRVLGRNSATKLEVMYEHTRDGYEAVFQEANSPRGSRPSLSVTANNESAISLRQASYTADPTRTGSIASGIHPDRAALVPRSPKSMRKEQPANTYEPQRRSEDRGHGFRGLDDIFSSTQAKPKLYYKLPSQDMIDDRLDMIKDLYSERGGPGQPGMKRYTFERDRGREEWVDNGPEFGHGKRGQDRLAGIGPRGRGGYRGRGRGNFYNGDSYRGGGRR